MRLQTPAATPGPGLRPDRVALSGSPGRSFSTVLGELRSSGTPADSGPGAPTADEVLVRRGDSLSLIARDALARHGLSVSPARALQAALQLARDNGLDNPDLIHPGQRINTASLLAWRHAAPSTVPAPVSTQAANTRAPDVSRPSVVAAPSNTLARETEKRLQTSSQPASAARPEPAPAVPPSRRSPWQVLDKTLERAVRLGYVDPGERSAVHAKVIDLARRYQFNPDHLAMVTLMESDGMNPRATNGHCHGLIQFCDGPNRGAAAVGHGADAQGITRLSALKQLDLVGRYFDELRQPANGRGKPFTLDELYLSFLYPAARTQSGPDTPLGIPGRQALRLYSEGDPNAGITRRSLVNGLQQLARDKLALNAPASRPGRASP
jgi:hypothetical protein